MPVTGGPLVTSRGDIASARHQRPVDDNVGPGRRQEAGGRRQEAGGRRQEAGGGTQGGKVEAPQLTAGCPGRGRAPRLTAGRARSRR
ncbi:hypothetical protein CIK67_00305 [Brachybacterium alimentarium]|nr:hypothetical protein CIK67_00305 [Brachybacterium alimentarium]